MPAARNLPGSTNLVASATGLTGLDQTVAKFTGSFWHRGHGAGNGTVWKHTDNSGNTWNGVRLQLLTKQGMRFRVSDGVGNTTVDIATNFWEFGWSHLAFMYDGANVHFIKNGVVHDIVAMTALPAAGGTRETDVGLLGFNCSIWDLRIFPGVALTVPEACALADPRNQFRGCKQRLFYQNNWRSLGNGAVRITDESGNGNHLTSSSTKSECETVDEPPWHRLLYGRTPRMRSNATAPGGGGGSLVYRRSLSALGTRTNSRQVQG